MIARWASFDRASWCFAALLVGLVWARIHGLHASTLDLHMDEAQYWAWAQAPDWGYFSKPPLVAWVIAATTALFGDAEWAVRLVSPIAHGIGAAALYALGRAMYGPWGGFWAGAGWLLMPAVWLSSGIASTDALLLPLWSIALLAVQRLAATRAWSWTVVLGLALGFGALAKYAMLYFPLCMALAAWWSRPTRAALLTWRGLVAGLIGLIVLAPNIYWNAQNAFATVRHTGDNAAIDGLHFNFDELSSYLIDQGGMLGPVMFIIVAGLIVRALRRMRALADEDRFLLAFIIPPLLVVAVVALLSRAHANWAASAYPAAMVWSASLLTWRRGDRALATGAPANLVIAAMVAIAFAALHAVAGWLEQPAGAAPDLETAELLRTIGNWLLLAAVFYLGQGAVGARWLAAGAVANLVIGAVIAAAAVSPDFAERAPGGANAFKRVRGWEATAQEIAVRALAAPGDIPFTAVLVDDRETYYELAYYWRHARRSGEPLPPVRMWLLYAEPHNHAEAADPMRVEEGARVLVVHANPKYLPVLAADFTVFRTVEHLAIPLGADKARNYEISVGEGFAPAPRDAAFEERVRRL